MSVQENMKGLYANVGMSVARMPFTRSVPTPTTSVVAYSYELDRVISARGMMRLLGWPDNLLEQSGAETEFRFLSGNGFSVPIAAMLTSILYSNPSAPWRKEA